MTTNTLALILFIAPFFGSYMDSHPGGKRIKILYISTEGYYRQMEVSFKMPNEMGWFHIPTPDYHFVTLKKYINPDENNEIELYMIEYLHDDERKPDSIHDLIQEKINDITKHYNSIPEFKLRGLHVREYLEKSKNKCIRIYVLLEDVRNKEESRRWSEQHALSCSFPARPRYTFELRYYHRYYDYNKDPLFSSKADKLFKSVKIKDNINISIIAYALRMSLYDLLHHRRGENLRLR